MYRYVENAPLVYVDPSGLQDLFENPDWHHHVGPPVLPLDHRDRNLLLKFVEDDPELKRKVALLLEALDSVSINPIWVDRCVEWVHEFLKKYDKIVPLRDQLPVDYQTPLYVGWVPGWTEHAVIIVKVKGVPVYLYKRLQGGCDHISFVRHPDLIYEDDPRWGPEVSRREQQKQWWDGFWSKLGEMPLPRFH